MATYKRPTLVLDAVRSVLSQTFQDFEFLVAVGADDGTYATLLNIADPRMKVFYWPDVGWPKVWDDLFALASGDYVALIHDDDFYEPRFLEALVGGFDGYPGVHLFTATGVQHLHRDGSRTAYIDGGFWMMTVLYSRRWLDALRERDGFVWNPARRFFPEADLLARITSLGAPLDKPVRRVGEALYVYRTYTSHFRGPVKRFRIFLEWLDSYKHEATYPDVVRGFFSTCVRHIIKR